MLDKVVFLKGMQYLNDYYVNFKFDIENDNKIEIWHEALSVFDELAFRQAIKNYCKSEIFAPQSPTSILQFHQTLQLSSKPTAESEWELVRESLVAHGLAYGSDRFYKSLKPFTAEICKEIESHLADMDTDSRDFVRNDFIKIYNIKLKTEIKQVLLGGSDQKKLVE